MLRQVRILEYRFVEVSGDATSNSSDPYCVLSMLVSVSAEATQNSHLHFKVQDPLHVFLAEQSC